MDSEFIALDKVGEQIEWLRNFLEDVHGCQKSISTVIIHCDS